MIKQIANLHIVKTNTPYPMIILKQTSAPFRKCKRIPDLEKLCKQTLYLQNVKDQNSRFTKCKETADFHNTY